MTNLLFNITSQTSTGIVLHINGIEDGKGVWVTYDVLGSTGVLPSACRYYTWHCKTSSGYITLNSSSIINPGQTLDYSLIAQYTLNVSTFFEYYVLQQLLQKIDLVSRRYPQTFPKTFALSELAVFIEGAVFEINLYPPLTRFWYKFCEYDNEIDMNFNPYGHQTGIPFEWVSLAADGALIQGLTSLGILESNLNFNYSDQGVNVTYNIVDPINRWYESILKTYLDQKDKMKKNYFGFQATGTVPFSIGWPGVVAGLLQGGGLGNTPFWRQSAARPL